MLICFHCSKHFTVSRHPKAACYIFQVYTIKYILKNSRKIRSGKQNLQTGEIPEDKIGDKSLKNENFEQTSIADKGKN